MVCCFCLLAHKIDKGLHGRQQRLAFEKSHIDGTPVLLILQMQHFNFAVFQGSGFGHAGNPEPVGHQGGNSYFAGTAEVAFTNKTPINKEIIDKCPNLKFISVLATGYNVVDIAYAREKGIPVANIPTYGTDSVGQFAIALLLEICHHIGHHNEAVHAGKWEHNPNDFGKAIAAYVDLDTLLQKSDVIAVHCPLFPSTQGIICKKNIDKMKDVVSTEPIKGDNPLLKAKNCIITPHMSWAPKESRQRIMDMSVDNVKAFLAGEPVNVVNK